MTGVVAGPAVELPPPGLASSEEACGLDEPLEAGAPPLSVVAGVSTGGSSASVEAPAAPDLACVSVIDQSCPYLGRSARCPASVLLFGFVGVACDRHQGHTLRQVHQLDPHCVPIPGPAYR